MKNFKSIISIFLSLLIILSNIHPVSASTSNYTSNSADYIIITDEEGVEYKLFAYNEALKISQLYDLRYGGGIGHCPSKKYKTFNYSLSRKQAIAANQVLEIEKNAAASLVSLFTGGLGLWGMAAGYALGLLGGETIYQSNLRAFIHSNKSTIYIKIKGQCVDRGTMQGEPMYDYDAVSMSFSW